MKLTGLLEYNLGSRLTATAGASSSLSRRPLRRIRLQPTSCVTLQQCTIPACGRKQERCCWSSRRTLSAYRLRRAPASVRPPAGIESSKCSVPPLRLSELHGKQYLATNFIVFFCFASCLSAASPALPCKVMA